MRRTRQLLLRAPCTYRVLARRYDTSSSFPDAIFVANRAFQVTPAAGPVSWDLATRAVGGSVVVDGKAPVASGECSGAQVRLTFVDPAGGMFDADVPCGAKGGTFSARVAPGTYTVLARRYDTSSSFPDATFVLVDALAIP